jgi:hypothetical protein
MSPKREPRWVPEPGRDFDLREYQGDQPTGRVANVRQPADHVEDIKGKHVRLTCDRRQITVVDLSTPKGAVLRFPWPSFVAARVVNEAGTARLVLELDVRVGAGIIHLSLWFDAAHRPELDRLVAHVRSVTGGSQLRAAPTPAESEPAQPEVAELPLLDTRCAPPDDDWLVFRPGDCSAEVLRRTALLPPSPTSAAGADV